MSEAIKPTPGPWGVEQIADSNCFDIKCECGFFIATCHDGVRGESNAEANARLIAEAGTVHHETGLTPRQLVERVKELEGALRGLDEAYCRSGEPLTKAERHEDRLRLIAARAALAKCHGEKE